MMRHSNMKGRWTRARVPLSVDEHVKSNPWNRASRTSLNVGSALIAVGFLVLLWQGERIAGADWTHLFDFVSFVKKWRTVSRYPEALSVALGAALFLGIAVGTFFGSFVRIDHRYTRNFLSNRSAWMKALLIVGIPMLLVLPFLTLRPYDEVLRSDRAMAFVVNNEIASVVFAVAMYCGYWALCLATVTLTRHFIGEK
jgi:hypothetical protein